MVCLIRTNGDNGSCTRREVELDCERFNFAFSTSSWWRCGNVKDEFGYWKKSQTRQMKKENISRFRFARLKSSLSLFFLLSFCMWPLWFLCNDIVWYNTTFWETSTSKSWLFGNFCQAASGVNQDHLVCFHLLPILTEQSDISNAILTQNFRFDLQRLVALSCSLLFTVLPFSRKVCPLVKVGWSGQGSLKVFWDVLADLKTLDEEFDFTSKCESSLVMLKVARPL